MGRRRGQLFKWVDGVGLVQVDTDPASIASPAVHGDEMPALEHPGGGVFTSKAKFRAKTRELGWVEVGNEKLSEKSSGGSPEKFSYEQYSNAFERAESVTRDPSKLRAWRNEMKERNEYVRERFRD